MCRRLDTPPTCTWIWPSPTSASRKRASSRSPSRMCFQAARHSRRATCGMQRHVVERDPENGRMAPPHLLETDHTFGVNHLPTDGFTLWTVHSILNNEKLLLGYPCDFSIYDRNDQDS